MQSKFHLMRVAGVDVHLDWSLAIIFFLISASLGSGLFPAWHPDWSASTSWLTAFAAALLFLVSVLVHEMSHALVGRARGMKIHRITLFIFGGMAHLEEDAREWKTEFYMAIVGPITSLVLGIGFIWLGSLSAGPISGDVARPEQVLGDLSPWATLLFWLGPVNIVLGLFNLVPGFPLDGGRVMRAAIWGATGDLHKATRWASNAGRGFAWLLIAAGIGMILGVRVPIFGTGFIGGLWLALIGWFLHNAAIMSYQQLLVQTALEGVPVSRLMLTDIRSVPLNITLESFVDEYILGHEQRAYPVIDGGEFRGIVCLGDVRKQPKDKWRDMTVRDIMTPADKTATISPQEDSVRALQLISQHGVNQLPVIHDGKVQGLLRREDVLRWLSLKSDSAPPSRRLRDRSA